MKDYAIRSNTVVCVILAFSRDSNKKGIATMESGRDTSAIEYSADTMLALNYTKLETGEIKSEDIDQLKKGIAPDGRREIRLKLLKKRMTECGTYIDMYFKGGCIFESAKLTHEEVQEIKSAYRKTKQIKVGETITY